MIPGFQAVRTDWPTEKCPVSFIFPDTQPKRPGTSERHTTCMYGDKGQGRMNVECAPESGHTGNSYISVQWRTGVDSKATFAATPFIQQDD
jgi:hypothetical protein